MPLPLFPITTVGSWPRSRDLIQAQRAKQAGRLSREHFEEVADQAVIACLKRQEDAGVDLVTDGELRRDNFYSFVTEKLDGTHLMTLSEMMEFVEDKAGFEELLQRLDVPAFAIKNPTAVGKVSRREPLAVKELEFTKQHTSKPIKVPLPGPYLLSRAMWVPEITSEAYDSKEALAEDVVALMTAEVRELAEAGATFIQFDEPVLTELVFSQGKTRTFMCAALAARKDPAEELDWAVTLINRVAESLHRLPNRPRIGVHVCRGNWSRREETLLEGNYRPLHSTFERLNVDQLVLEYATPRAGDLIGFEGKELGLGVVNPRTEDVESPDHIMERVEEALEFWTPDKLFLNPDCGFATFSERAMNSDEVAVQKMESIRTAAESLRARF